MKPKIMLLAALLHGTVALGADTVPFGCGWGLAEALGNGSTSDQVTPIAVDVSGVLAGKSISQISTSGYHTLAVTTDGKVYAWGSNNRGELGDGTTTNRSTPVAVDMTGALLGKTVIAVEAGFEFSLALTSDGRVYSWGGNTFGHLGDGTYYARHTPDRSGHPPGCCRARSSSTSRWRRQRLVPSPPMASSSPGATTPTGVWAMAPRQTASRPSPSILAGRSQAKS
jgi:alpha-tubulin suppressor-like RCC1 family protein